MTSITDILEELQANYPSIDIFDIDTYNNIPALSILENNSSLFLYVENYLIKASLENEITGDIFEATLVEEEDLIDAYQELSSFLFWATRQNPGKEVKKELTQILDVLEEAGIDPDPTYDPSY